MALSFPLLLETFWDVVCEEQGAFWLTESVNTTQTRAGEVLVSDSGGRLWQGSASLFGGKAAHAAKAEALIALLRQSAGSFIAYPKRRAYPVEDPDGSILGSSTVTIQNLPAGGREIALQGLPVGYVLSPGDFLSFTYGSPAKYALHQVVVGATAGAAGIASGIEVVPPIRPGAAVSDTVLLKRPRAEFIIVPNSYDPATYRWRTFADGSSFSFIQKI